MVSDRLSLGKCVFAARLASAEAREAIARRVQRVAHFYRPVGDTTVTFYDAPELALAYGSIAIGQAAATRADLISWGGTPPPGLDGARELVDASDRELRSFDTAPGAIAVTPEAACVVAGAAPGPGFYTARSGEVEVWASHAVAAGALAWGRVRIDPSGLTDYITIGAVAGDRTLLHDVRVLPDATRVRITREEVSMRSYWPASERWRPVPEEEAYPRAERALLGSLERRVDGGSPISLGLTGGLDSRVAGVALKLLGTPFEAHTFGGARHPDVPAAEAVARHLGVNHSRLPREVMDEETAFASVDREARWADGHAAAGFLRNVWPEALRGTRIVTGHGGETGRAFYYRTRAAGDPKPRAYSVRQALDFEAPLRGASRRARQSVRARVRQWIEEAEELGYRGWSALDVVLAEQRVRRWALSHPPRGADALVAAFATPEVLTSLASLPLAARLNDGFHRRFLEAHDPDIEVPVPARLASMPRRSAARLQVASLAAPLRKRLPWRAGRELPWFGAPGWEDRPRLKRWVTDEVLASRIISEGLGDRWARRVRSEFLGDEPMGTRLALRAAGPVALELALEKSFPARG